MSESGDAWQVAYYAVLGMLSYALWVSWGR